MKIQNPASTAPLSTPFSSRPETLKNNKLNSANNVFDYQRLKRMGAQMVNAVSALLLTAGAPT